MADIRPFRALRYDAAVAGEASKLIAPPYDVVSEAERPALYARSEFNVSRVDYGAEGTSDTATDNRYTRAGRDLDEWRRRGVLVRDPQPRLYVYDQEFEHAGERRRRRAVFGRLRLEEWEKGIVLPHEATGAVAKADRLRLLQATRVHLSPILALYRADGVAAVEDASLGALLLDAKLPGERHTLRPLAPAAAEAFARSLTGAKLYVADGHHRYETALAYRDERRAAARRWTGEEPENFILAALVSTADPGLVVLPTHRLARLPHRPQRGLRRLLATFSLEDAGVANAANLDRLVEQLREAGRQGPAFGVVGLEPGRLHLLAPRNFDLLLSRLADAPPALARLDVTILQRAVFPALDFEEASGSIDYTEDHRLAAEAVAAGVWDVAFLLNPTPVDQVIAVADAGQRMPRKSTFFYPKLATGVVMLRLD
ncbi:MAG TPA: DUF1015 domain-containing protein [Dehalococcoidia bacterium]